MPVLDDPDKPESGGVCRKNHYVQCLKRTDNFKSLEEANTESLCVLSKAGSSFRENTLDRAINLGKQLFSEKKNLNEKK